MGAKDSAVVPGPVPADVLGYWRAKALKIGFDYRDVWGKEHNAAFTAAKIMRTDVLEAMQQELDVAIERGVPFEQWKRDIEPRMRSLGWWEPHDVKDPETGKKVKIDPPRRLNTIFQTNMRTARDWAVGPRPAHDQDAPLPALPARPERAPPALARRVAWPPAPRRRSLLEVRVPAQRLGLQVQRAQRLRARG